MANRYCLSCRGEFQNWVQVCPVCNAPLADELPPLREKERAKRLDDPLVLVATAPNEPLARMWAGILENEGIRSVVKNGDLKAAGYGPSLLSTCEIHVLASHEERAREILGPLLEGICRHDRP
jgi:hypothetical protein